MMYLFHFFRSFLPLQNPIGFGASDFIELAFAAILVALLLARLRLEGFAKKLAKRTRWCMLFLGLLTIALRLALLPHNPVPIPSTADDTSYLLLGDTLSHLRLANPAHPFHRFFETDFVLQEPTYSSIFPLGQGIALALGQTIFGNPWMGVLLSEAAFCALCYWMLLAWTEPVWALAGGLLALFEFGPLSYWMNSYWGGAVSGIAGCLVFGALPRICKRGRRRDAVALGLGLGAQLLTRPYEGIFLLAAVGLYFIPDWRALVRAVPWAAVAALPAVALTLGQNKAVTGKWTTLPYMQSRFEYGVPTTFTMQPNPVPHRTLTQEEQLDYAAQSQVHDREARKSFVQRAADRIRNGRFFFLPSLYLALPALLFCWRDRRILWALAAVVLFVCGSAIYPYFHPHYIAAAACLCSLLSVIALQTLSRWRAGLFAARLIFLLAAVHFAFWYAIHLSGNEKVLAAMPPYESWDFVNYGDPEGRIPIRGRLAQMPGKQLVFVRFGPEHGLREWIYNRADIDDSKVVRALDLGPAEDEKLRGYYPDRTAWLLEPDARPPRLTPYKLK
ncbi:MAG TPA: hypothetical protein VFW83_05425 [Bryobacteraceae bacterium]|nr:hypothetical protein [Bryobacteraceae bacterium]